MTEKIFENDSYCRSFAATVLECTENDGAFDIVLDKTAFFPEGGGQGADSGTINGIDVTDEVLTRYRADMTREEGEKTGIELAKEIID